MPNNDEHEPANITLVEIAKAPLMISYVNGKFQVKADVCIKKVLINSINKHIPSHLNEIKLNMQSTNEDIYSPEDYIYYIFR